MYTANPRPHQRHVHSKPTISPAPCTQLTYDPQQRHVHNHPANPISTNYITNIRPPSVPHTQLTHDHHHCSNGKAILSCRCFIKALFTFLSAVQCSGEIYKDNTYTHIKRQEERQVYSQHHNILVIPHANTAKTATPTVWRCTVQ